MDKSFKDNLFKAFGSRRSIKYSSSNRKSSNYHQETENSLVLDFEVGDAQELTIPCPEYPYATPRFRAPDPEAQLLILDRALTLPPLSLDLSAKNDPELREFSEDADKIRKHFKRESLNERGKKLTLSLPNPPPPAILPRVQEVHLAASFYQIGLAAEYRETEMEGLAAVVEGDEPPTDDNQIRARTPEGAGAVEEDLNNQNNPQDKIYDSQDESEREANNSKTGEDESDRSFHNSKEYDFDKDQDSESDEGTPVTDTVDLEDARVQRKLRELIFGHDTELMHRAQREGTRSIRLKRKPFRQDLRSDQPGKLKAKLPGVDELEDEEDGNLEGKKLAGKLPELSESEDDERDMEDSYSQLCKMMSNMIKIQESGNDLMIKMTSAVNAVTSQMEKLTGSIGTLATSLSEQRTSFSTLQAAVSSLSQYLVENKILSPSTLLEAQQLSKPDRSEEAAQSDFPKISAPSQGPVPESPETPPALKKAVDEHVNTLSEKERTKYAKYISQIQPVLGDLKIPGLPVSLYALCLVKGGFNKFLPVIVPGPVRLTDKDYKQLNKGPEDIKTLQMAGRRIIEGFGKVNLSSLQKPPPSKKYEGAVDRTVPTNNPISVEQKKPGLKTYTYADSFASGSNEVGGYSTISINSLPKRAL